ncbi:MAG: FmdB family zinc ribbon protein, partial [Gammaproteobacteria bacterium]
QCQACEAVVEELQKISDAPLKKCPECGKNKLVKLVSAPSFRLSGTGWYETDFKTDNDKKRNLASDDSSKKSDSSEGGKDKEAKSKSDSKSSDKKATPAKPKAKSKKSK